MKKGFTLIEMIAVIVIIALISLIMLPLVINQVNKSKGKLDESLKKVINESAITYIETNGSYTANYGSVNCIKIKDLVDYGYLDEPLINPSTKEEIDQNLFVKVTSTSPVDHEFEITDTCAVVEGLDKEPFLINVVKGADNIKKQQNYYGEFDYRYNGPSVSNYITYNNELWRIIGVVNGKVKIIKDEYLGTYAWDTDDSNDWTTSSLKDYLNNNYYNTFTQDAKNMLEVSTFNLGGISIYLGDSEDDIYNMENSETTHNGRPIKLDNTKIALMYPSDYAYSVQDSCGEIPYSYQDDINCASGTWLFDEVSEWLLSPSETNSEAVGTVNLDGSLYMSLDGNTAKLVRPVLYLKNNIQVLDGDGTLENPYSLGL